MESEFYFTNKEFKYNVPDAEDIYKNKLEQWLKQNNTNYKLELPRYDTPSPENRQELRALQSKITN